MMKRIYLNLISAGVNDFSPPDVKARVIVLNKIAVISFLIGFIVLILVSSQGLWIPSSGIIGALTFVVLPIVFFNKHGYYNSAKYWYSIGVLIVASYIGMMNAHIGKIAPSEVIIFGISAVIPILFDKTERILIFCLYVLATLVIFIYRQSVVAEVNLYSFVVFINHSVAFACIFFFSRYYQKAINQRTSEIETLLEELKISKEQVVQDKLIQESLINYTSVLLALVDKNGFYLNVNKAYEEAIHIPKSEIIGRHFSEILPSEFVEFHMPKFEAACTGVEVEFEERELDDSKDRKCMLGKYSPVFDESTNAVKYISVFKIDITRQKDAEEALIKINKTKDKLFSIIAHDLVGPIHNLDDVLYLNDIDQISEIDLARYNGNVRQRLGVIKHMMFNLLHWAKRQFQGASDENEIVSIERVVDETIELYSDSISRKQIKINKSIPNDLKCQLDKVHMEVIIRNLVSNAVKYSQSKGMVTIELIKKEGYKELVVSDNGIGISADKLEKIRNQENLHSRKGTMGEEGVGLGLHLCYDLAKWNNWNFDIESVENEGTRFTLEIPLNSE